MEKRYIKNKKELNSSVYATLGFFIFYKLKLKIE